jgi:L-rhamnose-H+ transport protein
VHSILLLAIGGGMFGCGMVLFTYSLRYVGIGVAFLLNISANTIIGSLLPVLLLNPNKLITPTGLIQIVALLLFLVGVIFTGIASHKRNQNLSSGSKLKGKNSRGIVLGMLSGLLTSAQGSVYSLVLPNIRTLPSLHTHSMLAASLPWIIIFNAAFIPCLLFFVWKNKTEQSFSQLKNFNIKELMLQVIMAVLYYASLLLFSKSSTLLGSMGSVITWPILMISIILTSNTWGFLHGEWHNAGRAAIKAEIISIVWLVIAVIILTFDGYLNIS